MSRSRRRGVALAVCRFGRTLFIKQCLILSCYQSEWQDDAELELFCDSDGRERAAHCNKRKQLKAIRRNADVNQHTNLSQPLIPVCTLLSCCVFSLSHTFGLADHLSL